MKALNPDNPIRSCLKHLAIAISPVILACCLAAQAQAQITWDTATTIAGDSDVSTAGTLEYAYHWDGGNQTVNGVTFTGTTNFTSGGSNVDLTGFDGQAGVFTGTTPPFTNLSTAYRATLAGSPYNAGADVTVTLKNLTFGRSYAVQVWIEDARGAGNSRSATLTSVGGNSVALDYNSTEANGGVGQYSIGTFTADATTKTFTIVPAGPTKSAQINALQVRDLTPAAKILAFGPGATIGPVSGNTAAISWLVPSGSNPAALTPTFTLAEGAACTVGGDPAVSGETRNFTSPVHYIVKASDFTTSGTSTDYTVAVTVASQPVTNGLVLALDASALTGLSNGATVSTWTDTSVTGNHATGSATYQTGALNGQPVVRFNANGNDSFNFTEIATIQTVFWVVKNTNPGTHFLLGHNDSVVYDFHAGNPNIWDALYSSASIRGGTTKLMGNIVDGTTTALPSSSYSLLSLVTTGNVRANRLSRDRNIGGRSWAGDIAEVLIYDRPLTAEEEKAVGNYLSVKYGLNTEYLDQPKYDTWAKKNGATGQTPDQDHDNDSVANGIEYFMGETGSSFTAQPGLDGSNTVTWTKDPAYNGAYEVQTSPDLSFWTNVDPRPVPAGGNLSYPLPTNLGKQFVRLLVTPAP